MEERESNAVYLTPKYECQPIFTIFFLLSSYVCEVLPIQDALELFDSASLSIIIVIIVVRYYYRLFKVYTEIKDFTYFYPQHSAASIKNG